MNVQHLSDEAIAAFADGVLRGHARERATKHVDSCAECRTAVREQREAAWVLRAAPAPAPPTDLMARLRSVPQTTPITSLPTVLGPDGSTMLATFAGAVAPMAALVAAKPGRTARPRTGGRAKPYVATAAAVALAGSLVAGSAAGHGAAAQPGTGSTVQPTTGRTVSSTSPELVPPVPVFVDVRNARP